MSQANLECVGTMSVEDLRVGQWILFEGKDPAWHPWLGLVENIVQKIYPGDVPFTTGKRFSFCDGEFNLSQPTSWGINDEYIGRYYNLSLIAEPGERVYAREEYYKLIMEDDFVGNECIRYNSPCKLFIIGKSPENESSVPAAEPVLSDSPGVHADNHTDNHTNTHSHNHPHTHAQLMGVKDLRVGQLILFVNNNPTVSVSEWLVRIGNVSENSSRLNFYTSGFSCPKEDGEFSLTSKIPWAISNLILTENYQIRMVADVGETVYTREDFCKLKRENKIKVDFRYDPGTRLVIVEKPMEKPISEEISMDPKDIRVGQWIYFVGKTPELSNDRWLGEIKGIHCTPPDLSTKGYRYVPDEDGKFDLNEGTFWIMTNQHLGERYQMTLVADVGETVHAGEDFYRLACESGILEGVRCDPNTLLIVKGKPREQSPILPVPNSSSPLRQDLDQGNPRRLAGMRVYLCGAMDRIADGGIPWRREITPILNKLGVIVLDPSNKPIQSCQDETDKEERSRWMEEGDYGSISAFMREVRSQDLRMINISDFVILRIDPDVHMCGSYEEMAIANHEKKPILIWTVGGKKQTPFWVFGQVPPQHIFGCREELLHYLHKVNNGINPKTYGRWFFFDKDVLYNQTVMDSLGVSSK